LTDYEKPSRAEDEYFAKQELERRREVAKQQASKMEADEKDRLRKEHWMKCPKCGMDLAELSVHGVKVDQCASCGGVFLDAGELDAMLASDRDSGLLGRVFSAFR
jgi:protein-arginine kinase activator protein McsA